MSSGMACHRLVCQQACRTGGIREPFLHKLFMSIVLQVAHFFTRFVESIAQVIIIQDHTFQLITKGYPVGLAIVGTSKQFYFPSSRWHAFDESIHLIWLVASSSYLSHYNITVNAIVATDWFTFDTYQAVFLREGVSLCQWVSVC